MLKFGLDEPGYTSQTGVPRTTLTPGAKEWHQEQSASKFVSLSLSDLCADEEAWLPRQSYDGLRIVVDSYFPEFSKRKSNPFLLLLLWVWLISIGPFDFTRMCPIPATFDDNFVLDYTKYPSLLIASGGSHHSYKVCFHLTSQISIVWELYFCIGSKADKQMMPIIGDLVMARMENTLDQTLTELWAIRDPKSGREEGGHAALKDKGRVNVEDITYASIGELPQVDTKIGVGLDKVDISKLSIAA